MTEKQKRFADEYIIDCNATRAYKAVYTNVKKDNAAGVNASKLLKNTKVRAYIDKRLEELHNNRTADAQEVMEYLTSVMRGKSESEVVVVTGEGEGITTATKVCKAPDEKEKLKAAELLGKRFGLFRDKLEIDANQAITFVEDLMPDE